MKKETRERLYAQASKASMLRVAMEYAEKKRQKTIAQAESALRRREIMRKKRFEQDKARREAKFELDKSKSLMKRLKEWHRQLIVKFVERDDTELKMEITNGLIEDVERRMAELEEKMVRQREKIQECRKNIKNL